MAPSFLNAQQDRLDLFVGTYTNSGKSEGIYVYTFDDATGNFSLKSKLTGIKNPSFLAFHQKANRLYAVSESGGESTVSSFAYRDGQLEKLNTMPSGSSGPCHIITDRDNRFVFVSNYGGGTLSVYKTDTDGSLKELVQELPNQGSGPDKDRQKKPHVHSATLSPDERFLLVQDLGTDRITVYPFDSKNATLPLAVDKAIKIKTPPGRGPRHIAFAADGNFVYVVAELTSSVLVYSFNSGQMDLVQELNMLAEQGDNPTGAADIHLSKDGKFLYTSNRGKANEINSYKVDKKTGKLEEIGRQSTMGLVPRNFAISNSGKFLLAANQNSDEIVIFSRDPNNGKLKHTDKRIEVGSPVCLIFN